MRRVRRWRRRFTLLLLVMLGLAMTAAVVGGDGQQQADDDVTLPAMVAACADALGPGADGAADTLASLCVGEPGGAPVGGDLDITTAECRVDGSTTPAPMANITSRMQAVMEALVRCFGRGRDGYGCWRPGVDGEHPLGRACDFMMAAATMPDRYHLEQGWRMANLLVEKADEWGILYVIWQDRIWHDERRDDGWRDYTRYDDGCPTPQATYPGGGDCHTLLHYDHVHVSVDP